MTLFLLSFGSFSERYGIYCRKGALLLMTLGCHFTYCLPSPFSGKLQINQHGSFGLLRDENYFTLALLCGPPPQEGAAYCVALCLSVRLSVCPSVPLWNVTSRHLANYNDTCRTVLRANIQNRKTSVFAYGPASRMYFSARAEGRISYGHLGRTNSCLTLRMMEIRLSVA